MDKATLQIPVSCSYQQRVYKYICSGNTIKRGGEQLRTYEAFNEPYLIPSLVDLLGRKKQATTIKSWVSQYGFLTVPGGWNDFTEKIDDFWREAQNFVSLWWLYEAVLNRKLDELKKFVNIVDIDPFDFPPPQGAKSHTVFTHNAPAGRGEIASIYDTYFKETTAKINEKPLLYYQIAVFNYITHQLEKQLEGLSFTSRGGHIFSEADRDHFKVISYLQPKNLLQALYLRFYIFLDDKEKKICASCGCIFTPSRIDVRYCSVKCKKREKMRRHRARKKEKEGGRK